MTTQNYKQINEFLKLDKTRTNNYYNGLTNNTNTTEYEYILQNKELVTGEFLDLLRCLCLRLDFPINITFCNEQNCKYVDFDGYIYGELKEDVFDLQISNQIKVDLINEGDKIHVGIWYNLLP
jgi:hypothetical protein